MNVVGFLRRRFRDLRLFWKLLVPFLVLILVMGIAGSFVTARYLSSRAQDDLERDLAKRSLDATAYVQGQLFYLLDSVRFAANIQGVAESVERKDAGGAARLLASALALRTELDLLVATDNRGVGLVEFEPRAAVSASGTSWVPNAFVTEVLQGVVDDAGDKRTGFMPYKGATMLGVAGPIRTDKPVVGAMVAGILLDRLAQDGAQRVGAPLGVYDSAGSLIGKSRGFEASGKPPSLTGGKPIRRAEKPGREELNTLYSPLQIRGGRQGTLAVTMPAGPALATARGAGVRLALILTIAMAAVVGLGAGLSRLILRQVQPLVATNRALGRGDLTVRAPVLGNDELGELASGFNTMAEQLQAAYEELEMRVAQRTEELQRVNQDLVKASQMRTEFFAAISHEFRTPLFAIIGHAELMLDPEFAPDDDVWQQEFGETIKGAGEDLLGRVNEILDLAKFQSGTMKVDLEEVRLDDAIRQIRGTIVPLAERSDLAMQIDIASDLPVVQADPGRLRQIILNLASNAIKYTPSGGEVRLEAAATNGKVHVSVTDTGVGIPKNVGEHLFEPFYQVRGTRAQKGQASTGLGLALVKRLVEAHGGTIWYTSKPGEGSTFTFTLRPAQKPRGKAAAKR